MAAKNIIEVSESSFESDVLKNPLPVLVDFWAVWCGPCRMIAPTVETLADKWQGKAVVAKLNVDDNQGVSERYGIMGIPTLLLFKNGQVVESVTGARSQAEFEKRFEPHFS